MIETTVNEPGARSVGTSVSPAVYRSFSPKLAPALTAMGGVLTVLGGLGTWIRTAELSGDSRSVKELQAVMGHSDLGGWALAVLGIVAVASAVAWTMSGLKPKLFPIFASLAIAGFAAWRLPILDNRIAEMIETARKSIGISGFYHVGFGWGAWLLFAAPFVLLVATLAGVLRELDLRKGIAR